MKTESIFNVHSQFEEMAGVWPETDRDNRPEALPANEDIRKVERRLKSEQKKLPKQTNELELPDANTEEGV